MLSANQFVEKLESLLSIGDRQIRIRADSGQIFVNFINLPKGVGGAGGGAEGENNRAMWVMYGFHKDHSIPVEKVKLKEILSRFDQTLKGRTGKPEAIAQYLAAFINKLAAEVEPKYTHTKPPVTSSLKKAVQLIGDYFDYTLNFEANVIGQIEDGPLPNWDGKYGTIVWEVFVQRLPNKRLKATIEGSYRIRGAKLDKEELIAELESLSDVFEKERGFTFANVREVF